jgi:hypothetical protein
MFSIHMFVMLEGSHRQGFVARRGELFVCIVFDYIYVYMFRTYMCVILEGAYTRFFDAKR